MTKKITKENIVNTSARTGLVPLTDAQSINSCNQLPKPNKQQLDFQDLELGLFIHFGMNTYTGQSSHNHGQHTPDLFNPTELNCDNWMEVAKAMGARFAVLTARHEEGFCLWPTQTTDYSVKNSPYKQGKGDIVQEFVDSCRRHDIKPCLYHSSYHDAHHTFKPEDNISWHEEWFKSMNKRLAKPEDAENFTRMQVEQIKELLTQYGDIHYLWLDHITETQGILNPIAVEKFWGKIVAEARRCQPQCLLLKADIHLSKDSDVGGGVHGGRAQYPLWHVCRRENQSDGQANPIPDPKNGYQYIVWESNTIFSGNWFWSGDDVKCVDEMMDHYYATIGRGATFLPNFAPDPCGLMTDKVLSRSKQFGKRIRKIFSEPLVTSESTGGNIELTLPDVPFTHIEIMEDLQEGQKIASYMIEIRKNGKWRELISGQSVGHKRLHQFDKQLGEAIRFKCQKSFAEPVKICRFAVYA